MATREGRLLLVMGENLWFEGWMAGTARDRHQPSLAYKFDSTTHAIRRGA